MDKKASDVCFHSLQDGCIVARPRPSHHPLVRANFSNNQSLVIMSQCPRSSCPILDCHQLGWSTGASNQINYILHFVHQFIFCKSCQKQNIDGHVYVYGRNYGLFHVIICIDSFDYSLIFSFAQSIQYKWLVKICKIYFGYSPVISF